jgi:hypothetical protein
MAMMPQISPCAMAPGRAFIKLGKKLTKLPPRDRLEKQEKRSGKEVFRSFL